MIWLSDWELLCNHYEFYRLGYIAELGLDLYLYRYAKTCVYTSVHIFVLMMQITLNEVQNETCYREITVILYVAINCVLKLEVPFYIINVLVINV